jgi:hypothetical protein
MLPFTIDIEDEVELITPGYGATFTYNLYLTDATTRDVHENTLPSMHLKQRLKTC